MGRRDKPKKAKYAIMEWAKHEPSIMVSGEELEVAMLAGIVEQCPDERCCCNGTYWLDRSVKLDELRELIGR